MRTKVCSSRPTAEHDVWQRRCEAMPRRSPATDGPSGPHPDGLFEKAGGEVTTKPLGSRAAKSTVGGPTSAMPRIPPPLPEEDELDQDDRREEQRFAAPVLFGPLLGIVVGGPRVVGWVGVG